jgi:rRNA maturation protein Nop10
VDLEDFHQDDFWCGECRRNREPYAIFVARERLPRCGICGHRLVYQAHVPLPTRYSPPWRWPRELRNRKRARLIGSQRIKQMEEEEDD